MSQSCLVPSTLKGDQLGTPLCRQAFVAYAGWEQHLSPAPHSQSVLYRQVMLRFYSEVGAGLVFIHLDSKLSNRRKPGRQEGGPAYAITQ